MDAARSRSRARVGGGGRGRPWRRRRSRRRPLQPRPSGLVGAREDVGDLVALVHLLVGGLPSVSAASSPSSASQSLVAALFIWSVGELGPGAPPLGRQRRGRTRDSATGTRPSAPVRAAAASRSAAGSTRLQAPLRGRDTLGALNASPGPFAPRAARPARRARPRASSRSRHREGRGDRPRHRAPPRARRS